MRVTTYIEPVDDLVSQRQLLCYWNRCWREAGFNPRVLTPNNILDTARNPMAQMEAMTKLSGVSGRLFRRWWLENDAQPFLMVEPNVLPNCTPDQVPDIARITRFSTHNSCVVGMTDFGIARRMLCTEPMLKPPFNDMDVLVSKIFGTVGGITTANRTRKHDEPAEGALFVEWPPELLLEQRKESFA